MTGYARTFVERAAATAATARSQAQHTFLRLRQPLDESSLPQPRVLEVGRTYRFAFTFVVPERLLPAACHHPCESPLVHEAHLQLPPSFGDASVAGDGNMLLDDMAPAMSRITYAIKVRLTRSRESDGQDITVAEGLKKIRVLPASEESPPLSVETGRKGEEYVLRLHKDIRKGIFKGKLGCLSSEVAQPKSLRLPPPKSVGSCPTSTMAIVVLRYDPTTDTTLLPQLGQLVSKMKVKTYFASEATKGFPRDDGGMFGHARGVFTETIALSSRCVESARWEQHEAAEFNLRRDSTLSISSSSPLAPLPNPTPRYRGGTFYTSKILVPITLPKGKVFVPTFHTCLISRVYTLELSLSASAPNTNSSISGSTITLKIPLQISSSGNLSTVTTMTEAETAEAEMDTIFQPRLISPPSPSDNTLGGTSQLPRLPSSAGSNNNDDTPEASHRRPPPGYSFFSGASQGVPIRIPSPMGISPGCG